MLAKISEGVADAVRQLKGSPFLAEFKYDGMRAQIHLLPGGQVRGGVVVVVVMVVQWVLLLPREVVAQGCGCCRIERRGHCWLGLSCLAAWVASRL